MYLFQKKPSDLNALEKKLLEMMKKQSIDYFPLGRAMCLPQSEQDEELSDKVCFILDFIVSIVIN